MKKPRLLALTTSYPLHPGSCAGVFVQSLYRSMSARYAIEVVCPAGCEHAPTEVDTAGADIRIHAVRYAPQRWRTLAQQSGGVVSAVRRAPWRALLLPVMLLALFWRCLTHAGNADVIHANWAACGVVVGSVGWLRGKPVITTLRGSDVSRAARSRLDRMILGLAVRRSRVVICVSEGMAQRVRELFPERASDIHVCLNGVDEKFFATTKLPSTSDALRVLAVGNLIRLKGFDVLIQAVARARHREHTSVCIVGSGPERGPLQTLATDLGLSGRVEFAGAVPVDAMPARYSAADVFVLSSRSEGRPNVVAEALASGLPVISTDLVGVQGMLDDDNGWRVPVDDIDAMASALDRAFEDRAELQRRGECARMAARDVISTWADTARCYEALFQAAMGAHAKRSSECAE